jgi:hypothetical protein
VWTDFAVRWKNLLIAAVEELRIALRTQAQEFAWPQSKAAHFLRRQNQSVILASRQVIGTNQWLHYSPAFGNTPKNFPRFNDFLKIKLALYMSKSSKVRFSDFPNQHFCETGDAGKQVEADRSVRQLCPKTPKRWRQPRGAH